MPSFSILVLLTAVALLFRFLVHRSRNVVFLDRTAKNQRIPFKSPSHHNKTNASTASSQKQSSVRTTDSDSLKLYMELYHKVQNIESFPNILPVAHSTLISFLSEAVDISAAADTSSSILSISHYDSASLSNFLADQHNATLDVFKKYAQRRDAGQPRELFRDQSSAIKWLAQAAPLKYVDGAWLGGIHKASTPFHLRRVTRLAWQILSEELGDGDLSKHHVHLYRELLESLDIHLPDANSADFISTDARDKGMDDPRVWKSAVAQLLISLFPHNFLPEILGFNLHFELLTNETLMAARELPELGINGYYFTLHISIDNTDSGHSAMALEAVSKYMNLVQERNEPIQDIWRRVQAGYLLSQTLSRDTTIASADSIYSLNSTESRVFEMIRLKAISSNKIHAACRARIGGMSLADWLEPPLKAWDEQTWRRGFLNALANASPWVRPGESNRSLLIRELGWKGRMFGAFTQSETEHLCAWIDGLSQKKPSLWTYADLRTEEKNIGSELVAEQPRAIAYQPDTKNFAYNIEISGSTNDQLSLTQPFIPLPPLQDAKDLEVTSLLPLWFAHTALLENTITTPYRTATKLQSNILHILRINHGFSAVENSIAGMDEDRRSTHSPDLIDIGLALVRHFDLPDPSCLHEILNRGGFSMDSTFPSLVLRLSETSYSQLALQIGLARAFLDLEDWVARQPGLLDGRDRQALARMVKRKANYLVASLADLAGDNIQNAILRKGYYWGRQEIEKVLYSS
ncbi:ABC transporter with duplicated ATPase domain-containing protein [Fusarium phyllophilum]|uniref:ABC transporter with duplicated ATPase domain-containing protein n=1 Tax=Fusarium phyllophilum TaxID=47803 RepID=A0A8H5NH62_9HYPO|nr:ABC transporter with duplicated ATPase domain-containing protein [Fusarium phyllophilum]